MAKAIAFFPWWPVEVPIEFGPARLMPYVRGHLPGDQPGASQADIDAVLEAYAVQPRRPVKKAALLEVDGWRLGDDPETALGGLFAARRALAFSVLSARSLFNSHFGYCSFDSFSLVVQRYVEGEVDGFAFWTRRRDGSSGFYWSSDEFAFHRPLHVNPSLKPPEIDRQLAALLMEGHVPENWLESVDEFNRANTDSPDIPEHVEMIMMKSAFEVLLDSGTDAAGFQRALDALLDDVPPADTLADHLWSSWKARFPKSSRPIQAWAREFCSHRGAAAHGAKAGAHFVWSERCHLAFASVLFPLVFKKVAEKDGMYTMSEFDRDRLRHVDEYVIHDPFVPFDIEDEYASHPWSEIDTDARMRSWHLETREAVADAIEALSRARSLNEKAGDA